MSGRILVDTGPIVAILSTSDPWHDTCFQMVEDRHGPLLTCWPVITEAAYLVRKYRGAVRRLLE